MIKDAIFYKAYPDNTVGCQLCPHSCNIAIGDKGKCDVRVNQRGKLYTMNYGEISSIALDPIEKKPLYHYKPGSSILSVGSFGCNFSCSFCQNYRISKDKPSTSYMPVEELVENAIKLKDKGNIGIAFTYNEPSIWYEYIIDTVSRLKEAGLKLIYVSNGFINEAPLRKLLPYIDAANIDLKAYNNRFYSDICGGALSPVKHTIELMARYFHIELTTLIIDGYNDKEEELLELASWISSINDKIPLHLSAYHPAYKFKDPPTSTVVLKKCEEIVRKKLKYVYIGNVYGVDNNTYCNNCGEKLVERKTGRVEINLAAAACPVCGSDPNIIL